MHALKPLPSGRQVWVPVAPVPGTAQAWGWFAVQPGAASSPPHAYMPPAIAVSVPKINPTRRLLFNIATHPLLLARCQETCPRNA